MEKTKKILVVLVFVVLGAWTVVGTVRAEDARPSADLTVDVLSQYVWRGFGLSDDSVVIQPSMTVSYLGAYVNFWGNYDTDDEVNNEANWNETDLTLGYTYDRLPYGMSLDVGGIYYALDAAEDSFELYAGLSATCPVTGINLGLTVYREFSHYSGTWYEISAGRDFGLPWYKATLSLSASAMYLDSDDKGAYADPDDPGDEFSNWLYTKLGAEVNVPVGQYFSVTPKVYYTFSVSDDADHLLESGSWDNNHDHFFGGVSVSFSF